MPDYKVTIDGKPHSVPWDKPTPPTHAEFDGIVAQIRAGSKSRSTPYSKPPNQPAPAGSLPANNQHFAPPRPFPIKAPFIDITRSAPANNQHFAPPRPFPIKAPFIDITRSAPEVKRQPHSFGRRIAQNIVSSAEDPKNLMLMGTLAAANTTPVGWVADLAATAYFVPKMAVAGIESAKRYQKTHDPDDAADAVTNLGMAVLSFTGAALKGKGIAETVMKRAEAPKPVPDAAKVKTPEPDAPAAKVKTPEPDAPAAKVKTPEPDAPAAKVKTP